MTIEDSFDVPFFLQTQASKVSSYHIQYIDRRLGGPVAKWLRKAIFARILGLISFSRTDTQVAVLIALHGAHRAHVPNTS